MSQANTAPRRSRNSAPIMVIGYVGHATHTMVTIDTGCNIALWPYSKTFYSGFSWFVPSRMTRLQLGMTWRRPLAVLSRESSTAPGAAHSAHLSAVS